MSKKDKNFLRIFAESLKLYFLNFDKFVKYMTFPVLGQLAGLILVFLLTLFYAKNMPSLMQKIPLFDNYNILVTISILIILPGLIIFMKSFWEYLVAYGSVNSMLENLLKSGKVYDFDAHTELVKRRTIPFIGLWFLFGVFSLISVIPFFWVPCAVLAVYFVLIFQVFIFEPERKPLECVKRSFELVKGHFISTFILLALIGALTYILLPQIINAFCEYVHLTMFFKNLLLPVIKELPLSELNTQLSYLYLQPLKVEDIAQFTVATFIAQIFIQYTLPLRTILWGLWYRELNGGKLYLVKEDRPKKRKTKKPSEKLMESSNKKFATKKIDRNILRRAMEKDDE